MRRRTLMVSATLTAGTLAAALTVTSAVAATPQASQANAALRYLYSQVGADGSVASSIGATEDTVISTADAGYDPATLVKSGSNTNAYAYMGSHASAINTAGGAAKYVLAWIAAGRPSALSSSAQSQLSKLNTPTGSGGYLNSNGAFHNSDATIETANSFSQSLAVLAEVASSTPLPAHAAGWLSCAQRSDGGFGYAITDATPTPPSACGDTSSDTNDTGIVLQALAAAGVTSASSPAMTYLHSAQQADGGFGFNGSGPSDPDSDALVIQALVALGQDPAAAAWSKSSNNAISNMESFADPKGSGGYIFPGNTTPDAFTTVSIPQALELKPYGAATTVGAGTSPGNAAPTASPTAAATASASASASASSATGTVPVPDTGADVRGGAGLALPLLLGGGIAAVAAVIRRRGTRGEDV